MLIFFFCFKQKTAYEMRISDWSSDVCSSDLGDPLPEAVLDSIRRTRLALKGPLETPSGKGYRSSNVRLREAFKLYANVRPARTLIPGGRYDNIDRSTERRVGREWGSTCSSRWSPDH